MRTTGSILAVTVITLVGCGGGSGGTSSRAAAAASAGATGSAAPTAATPGTTTSGSSAPVSSGALPTPRVINLLLGAAAPVTTATGSSGGSAPAGGATTPAGGATNPAATPAPSTGAALHGTIPPDPTTGFDGSLFFVGERLAPGSFFLVTVNGVPTKTLPATFYSSELLSTYVYLTVPATYTFQAIAPDGSSSTPVTFTVPNGGVSALLGQNAPSVQMVYPTRLAGSFAGTVWLLGDQFMPGAVATIQQPNLPPMIVPLLVVNERTAGWVVGPLQPGSVTVTVTNPTLLSSTAVTLPVGATPPGAAAATPSAYLAGGVSSPFLGTVTVYGSDLALGAVMELRPVGGATVTSTPLVRISSGEAWWTLVYPAAGQYEVRVVNPGGAASSWMSFDVR